MKNHKKKMVAPIVVTGIVVLYFAFYFGLIIYLFDNMAAKMLLGVIPALLGATMIWVCVQRIREIKGGEEDDLGQY